MNVTRITINSHNPITLSELDSDKLEQALSEILDGEDNAWLDGHKWHIQKQSQTSEIEFIVSRTRMEGVSIT